MEQMNFGSKWRSWVAGCLSSGCASVVVNGAPMKEFEIKRGVRQRDPPSPFLFIIMMEGYGLPLNQFMRLIFLEGCLFL